MNNKSKDAAAHRELSGEKMELIDAA